MPNDTEKSCKLELQPQGRRIRLAKGTTVLEAVKEGGIPLASDCGGNGRCGRCRVKIISGEVSMPDKDELAVLDRKQVSSTDRLACRTTVNGDAKILIPSASLRTEQALLLDGKLRSAEAVDRICCRELTLSRPNLDDQRSDLQRLIDGLSLSDGSGFKVHPQFVHRLSELIRSSKGSLTVFLKDGIPIGVGEPQSNPYGMAVDIGTTSIAGRLVNLCTGAESCSAGIMNPQISLGEDVISRLDYAIRHPDGGAELASMLREALDSLARKLCERSRISPFLVTDVVICANTAISHLLLKLPVSFLARAPYVAGFSTPLELAATDLGLNHIPCARVRILPCIQGFIGGDHVAMILGCDMDRGGNTIMGIDIGTNTEIALVKPGNNGGLFVASCASGPALEGAHIRDGMRAGPGAIEKVRITDHGPAVKTVQGDAPIGICGSGLVDTVAELLKAGILGERGQLKRDAIGIQTGRKVPAYQLVPSDESGSGEDILITQKDISEIQLAKAAIHAGILTMLEKTETPLEQVSAVFLAGAFGSHINIDSAISIGLLPKFPDATFIEAGNAACAGASLALISKKESQRASQIARKANQIELAGDPKFKHLLAKALRFETRPV
jgi:uncharacterized 2Fe-2S/4Fe-4S cluster protein (DUF4445 family)